MKSIVSCFVPHNSTSLAFERGIIDASWTQIKFFDRNFGQRRRGQRQDCAGQSEEPAHRNREKQNHHRVQSHFSAKNVGDEEVYLDLLHKQDRSEREPEFRQADTQSDEEDRKCDQDRSDVRQELAKKCEDAKDKSWLHTHCPQQDAGRGARNHAVDRDASRPCRHLVHHSDKSAPGFLAMAFWHQCEIAGDERSWVRQDKNQDQQGEYENKDTANHPEGRTQEHVSHGASLIADSRGDLIGLRQGILQRRIAFGKVSDLTTDRLPRAGQTLNQGLQFIGKRGNCHRDDQDRDRCQRDQDERSTDWPRNAAAFQGDNERVQYHRQQDDDPKKQQYWHQRAQQQPASDKEHDEDEKTTRVPVSEWAVLVVYLFIRRYHG